MPLDPDRVLSTRLPDRVCAVDERDVILYALAVGLGSGEAELDFVYERSLRMVPSAVTMFAFDDTWFERAGMRLADVLHAAQRVDIHAPLPVSGNLRLSRSIAGLVDKGEGRPAFVLFRTDLSAHDSGAPVATALATLFVRDGGGFGGSYGEDAPQIAGPAMQPPDERIEIVTSCRQAMLFRLLGDRNALHVDPQAAREAGFHRPILHGACTFGVVCAALLRTECALDPARIAALDARFVGPVLPGETLELRLWRRPGAVAFALWSAERNSPLVDRGHATLVP